MSETSMKIAAPGRGQPRRRPSAPRDVQRAGRRTIRRADPRDSPWARRRSTWPSTRSTSSCSTWGLPDAQGLAAVRRAHAAAPRVALVVLTGLDDESLAVQALQEGAQDYLIKGQIETRGLLRALRYAIERKRLVKTGTAA